MTTPVPIQAENGDEEHKYPPDFVPPETSDKGKYYLYKANVKALKKAVPPRDADTMQARPWLRAVCVMIDPGLEPSKIDLLAWSGAEIYEASLGEMVMALAGHFDKWVAFCIAKEIVKIRAGAAIPETVRARDIADLKAVRLLIDIKGAIKLHRRMERLERDRKRRSEEGQRVTLLEYLVMSWVVGCSVWGLVAALSAVRRYVIG